MLFNWYRLFNLDEFLSTGLVSRTIQANFLGVGEKTVLITKGNEVSVLVDDAFIPIEFQGKNPYGVENRAVYKDSENFIWIGFPQ